MSLTNTENLTASDAKIALYSGRTLVSTRGSKLELIQGELRVYSITLKKWATFGGGVSEFPFVDGLWSVL